MNLYMLIDIVVFTNYPTRAHTHARTHAQYKNSPYLYMFSYEYV